MPILMPAAVTPMTSEGKLDVPSLMRLFGWFESARVDGVVLAGTNGEGPSLGPYEKKELIQKGVQLRDSGPGMRIILGVATPSLEEAKWLARQTHQSGGDGILLMPPSYFRSAPLGGIEAWFREVVVASPVPVWLYNFPKMTGYSLPAEMFARLSSLEQFKGVKDSSGDRANLVPYREALPDKELLVGDETILPEALAAGWQGSISGAANVVAGPLRRAIEAPASPFWALLEPLLHSVRAMPQPMAHKALLKRWGILAEDAVRLPLLQGTPVESLEEQIFAAFGPIGT